MRQLLLQGSVEPDPFSNLEPDYDSFDLDRALIKIKAYWQRAAEGIITACVLFNAADALCSTVEERDRLVKEMPYPPSKMRTIAEEAFLRFRDPAVRKMLPPHFNSIYELAVLPRWKFEAALRQNKIKAEMTGAEVTAIKGRGPRAQQTGVLLWKFYRDEPLEGSDADRLKHRLYELCAPLKIRPVEPKPRNKRSGKGGK